MKHKVIFFFASLLIFVSCTSEPAVDRSKVSPVIGDLSARLGKGLLSPAGQNEVDRVRTHLAFAEYVLRHNAKGDMSAKVLARRAQVLDLLHDYWKAGVFPGNYDYPDERRPCFVDQNGNVCAVGYLVAQTAGREITDGINAQFQYADIDAMHDTGLEEWIAGSGFSKGEIAMIQPTYGSPTVRTEYAGGSMILTGVGTASSILTLGNPGSQRWIPVVGLTAGLAQAAIGYVGLKHNSRAWNPNLRKESLSMLNIGVGTTNFLLNTYALLRKRPLRNKATSVNLFSVPMDDKRMAMGISLSRRF